MKACPIRQPGRLRGEAMQLFSKIVDDIRHALVQGGAVHKLESVFCTRLRRQQMQNEDEFERVDVQGTR